MMYIVEVGSFSLPKPGKRINEDFLLLPTYDLEDNIVFAVADGVGSLEGADKASKCVINAIDKMLKKENFSIEAALYKAKEEIDNLTIMNSQYINSASTITLVQITKKNVVIGHIGDCRAYAKRDNKLVQLTKDHTRYQDLIDTGEHSIRKLQQHKERLSSVITRVITNSIELKFDIINIPINELIENNNLVISVMSDGAYSHWQKRPKFSDKTMNSPLSFVNSLRKRIEKAPTDDFTCINVKIEQFN